ncbi:MAG: glycosyltransferase [Alteromonadaceae bacterium]|nr:glycosyltransferase [Alteromonadaceae bacterium]
MKGIKFISYHEPSGYAIAGYRYLRGLINYGVPVTWTPMVVGSNWGMDYQPFLDSDPGIAEFASICNIDIEYNTVIIHTTPKYFPLWKKLEKEKKIVGCTVWETDIPPKSWIEPLNCVDELLLPCFWNRDVFLEHGINVPIHIYPHICTDTLCEDTNIYPDIDEDDFVFYTINTWTERKELSRTVEAYFEAFTADDPVTLIIKTTKVDFTKKRLLILNESVARTMKNITKKYSNPAKIVLLTGNDFTDDEILSIHARGDCYISLTHAEGWGIGAFDAATYGKQIIMTGYGGQLDYLPKDLAHLVDFKLIPVKYIEKENLYTSKQHWASPDLQHAIELMNDVFNNQEESKSRGDKLKAFVAEKFNESVVTNRLQTDLNIM